MSWRRLHAPYTYLIPIPVLFLVSFFLLPRNLEYSSWFQHVHGFRKAHNTTLPVLSATWVEWGTHSIPQTKVLFHYPGFTVFDNVYLYNGTFYVVSDSPESIPSRRMVISRGLPVKHSPQMREANEPTEKELQVISASDAVTLFGTSASLIGGTTFLVNDAAQFLSHYYHLIGENLACGLWRLYSALDPDIPANGITSLAPPRRLIFPRITAQQWRDRPQLNQYILHAAFPGLSIEYDVEWLERANMLRPSVYDRLVLVDRAARHRGPSIRPPSYPFPIKISHHFWEPIRRDVVRFVRGVEEEPERPVVTYISRQKTKRRLTDSAHSTLVEALESIGREHNYEINIVSMEDWHQDEQIRLVARTTILLGIHGNGLTHCLWMKPRPQSAVIEMVIKDGFSWDYEYLARSIGIQHYTAWHDQYWKSPTLPRESQPEGFHGSGILANASLITNLIHQRLRGVA